MKLTSTYPARRARCTRASDGITNHIRPTGGGWGLVFSAIAFLVLATGGRGWAGPSPGSAIQNVDNVGDQGMSSTPDMALLTDQQNYQLEDTIWISGWVFTPSESVRLQVTHYDGTPTEGLGYDPWTVTAAGDGTIETFWVVPLQENPDEVLLITATGDSSDLVASTTAVAAPPAVSLEQMRNGASGAPTSPISWVTGNAGSSNAHLIEKWSQAYRAVFTNFTAGDSVEFVIGYDITQSSKHAIDYLTYYDRLDDPSHTSVYGHTQETIDPLAGIGPLPGPVYSPIPPPPAAACSLVVPYPVGPAQSQPCTSFDNLDNDPTQVRMTLYGGTFVAVSPVSYDTGGDPSLASSEARVRVKFIANGSTIVLLWGGHLGSFEDWGLGNSAGGISGSPYHNRAIELRVNGVLRNVGNQDLSLSADAISPCEILLACPPDVTIQCDEPIDPANTGVATYTAGAECGDITVSYTDAMSGDCPTTITRTWTATAIGGAASCIQIITVVDTTGPAFTGGCPADTTVECDAIPPPATVTATDDCHPLGTTVVMTESVDLTGCGGTTGTITRTWTATDGCGNTSVCQQVITVVDTTPPAITCPADITVECVADVPIPDIGSVTTSDNCGGTVIVTHVSDGPLTGSCPGTITRTYRATDACGNFAECTQTITVDDTTPPTITCPAAITVDCVANIPAADAGLVSTSDNCGGTVTVTHVGDSPLSGACPATVTRTYGATDECGNYAECTLIITVDDTTPPTITCPAGITVECVADVPAADIGLVTASDNCGGTVTVTHVGDGPLSGACPATITRTYGATDECGNYAECTQVITVDDTTPPSITCPAPVTVECAADVPAADVNSVTVSDNCGGTVTVTHVGDGPLIGSCPGTITRTYGATDECGNYAECTQVITVDDTTPPSITCPAPVTVECVADVPTPDIGSVTASDNCGGIVTVTHVSDGPLTGACPATITRTYGATDDCGNYAECTQVITVDDTTAPSITCPAPVTVECVTDVPTADVNSVTASDNCGGTVTVTHVGDGPLVGSCPGTITRTYGATDECGNYAECTQVITVDDTTPPAITCPAPVTVECVADVPTPDIGSVTASDNCGGTVTVTHVGDGPLTGACPATITRTYGATDECGNYAECTQVITIDDTTPPTISCPGDLALQCPAEVPACDPADATASDNCGAVDITCDRTDNAGSGCAGDPLVITDTYTATDACGNTAACSRTITVVDDTPPTLTCPAAITVECVGDVPPPNIGLLTASDNCGGPVTITHVGDSPLTGGGCGGTILRTYRGTDDCGNFVECTQTITVDDTTPPQIVQCPGNLTYECELGPIGQATFDDNCAATPTITVTVDTIPGTCPVLFTYEVTATATDQCGNVSNPCTWTVILQDTGAPVITDCPAPVTVECMSDIPAPDVNLVIATDDCGGPVTITHEGDSPLSGACPATITRTYRATDACGHYTECTQTITVDDTTPPSLTCPADVQVQCPGDIPDPDAGAVTASDNCGGAVDVSFVSDVISDSGCANRFVVTRTYRGTDECGNTADCSQIITVHDQINPNFLTFPNDTTVSCFGDVPAPNTALVTAEDNCSPPTIYHSGDQVQDSTACGATISRQYTAVDACGLVVHGWQTITVLDTDAPAVTCPADITVSCADDVPPADIGSVTATDNCGGTVTITHVGDSPLSGDGCSGTITRTYGATDPCGNYAECTQTITVEDTTPPTITCPAGIVVECAGDVPPADIGDVTASDDCGGAVTITYVGDSPLSGGPCGGTITRTYGATDPCGNYAECTQTITIEDTTPPVCHVPGSVTVEVNCPTEEICLPVSATDNCDDDVTCTVVSGPGSITNGMWCFTPVPSNVYAVMVECTDDCGNTCESTFFVSVPQCTSQPPDSCLIIVEAGSGAAIYKDSSPKNNNSVTSAGSITALNGQQVVFPISIGYIQPGLELGGLDLLLCYDGTALSLVQVNQGSALDEWEYFTYRLSANSNCTTGPCPSGLVRIIAIADMDNGPALHPSEPAFRPIGTLAELVFQITTDRNFIGQCVPVKFCWYDCADNTFSTRSGDTLFVDTDHYGPECLSNPKYYPVPGLCFTPGTICIGEPPDDRGDINLNGIANEVADAVLFSNFFIYGDVVWDPVWKDVQILATDVNDDGIVLTVADLVYLIRIITGDEQPYPAEPGTPKVSSYNGEALTVVHYGPESISVRTDSPVDLGGALFVFRASGTGFGRAVLGDAAADMAIQSSMENGEIRVLVTPRTDVNGARVASGSHELISIPIEGDGSLELAEVQLADANGAVLASRMAKNDPVPTSYSLMQNYPNPFNAGTVIRFDLKESTDWTLKIYNVAGQVVRSFSGFSDASQVTVTWDGTDNRGRRAATGVYFYRIDAGGFIATKKMMLLK